MGVASQVKVRARVRVRVRVRMRAPDWSGQAPGDVEDVMEYRRGPGPLWRWDLKDMGPLGWRGP